ncbi:17085_t:CDS:2, partial [Cetraspora pellucida]
GTTSNIANYLCEKNGITKQNYQDYLDVNKELFFKLPKQAQRLREMQHNNYQAKHDENIKAPISPLDVLLDIKTRWNSTFIT